MKYHIDTIPLWDAINLNSECPLCVIARHTELNEAERLLGASVMDPDTRIKVNECGFCKEHQSLLIAGNNRLGLGLMMQSHIDKIKGDILSSITACKNSLADKKPLFFTKSSDINNKIENSCNKLNKLSHSCILCNRLNEHMERYIENFVLLWKNDDKFRKTFADSKGLCIEHIAQIIPVAYKKLSSSEAVEFLSVLEKLTNDSIARQESELDTFCKKWDYRNADLPWGNSKDAVERIINKLQGWCVGDEPHPDDRNKSRKF